MAGAAEPRDVRECRQVRAGRHVRQGVPRRLDQGRHRHRGDSAQADLQSEVILYSSFATTTSPLIPAKEISAAAPESGAASVQRLRAPLRQ